MKKKDVKKTAILAFAGGGGMIIGDMVTKNIPSVAANPTMAAGVKIAIGVVIGMQKGDMMTGLGVGMAASGVKDLASSYIPGVQGIGFHRGTLNTQMIAGNLHNPLRDIRPRNRREPQSAFGAA